MSVGCAALLSGCFKDEPLNAECDIEAAYVSMDSPLDLFLRERDTVQVVSSVESNIVFQVRPRSNVSSIAMTFTTTPGAIVEPENGSVQDFSNGPVTYTVTSEDGAWSRTYTVSFVIEADGTSETSEVTFFDFENPYIMSSGETAKFYSWTDYSADGVALNNWATANAGYSILHSNAALDEYPTTVLEEGYEGKGARLVTMSTGEAGRLFKMPLAAGNLFIGSFDTKSALQDALSATKFGRPMSIAPKSFAGYFKYTPGEVFTDKNSKVVEGRVDKGSIYSVIYRNVDASGNEVALTGNDVLTNENLVAKAIVEDVSEHSEWTRFKVDYEYLTDIDEEILANKGYSLAIVFSASSEGDLFCGAVGSTLCVDNVELILK